MTNEERQQSLENARLACEWLGAHVLDHLLEPHRAHIAALIEEFARLDAKEMRQLEHVKRIAKKAGRPRLAEPGEFAMAKRKSRAKLKKRSQEP